MTAKQKTQAKNILNVLSKQEFVEWYDRWIDYSNPKSYDKKQLEKILEDIVRLFNL